jgi:predicted nucleic acid-binding Zn ribbon protein
VAVVFAIRYVSDTATGLTYLAVVAVPPLAAAALGGTIRGSRPALALCAVPLFAIAWAAHRSLAGEAAAAALSALSCVTLGVLLAAVTPPGWLKVGIVLMAAADSWLVISDLLQAPNAALIAAHPAAGLPRLQSELFGSVSMGYGDVFVAALLGAVLAVERRRQSSAALLTYVIAALFDLLFLTVRELPATVPVALVLIGLETRRLRCGRVVSAARRRWRRAAVTPRRAR